MPETESERLLELLRKAMRMLDVRHRELAKRLKVSPSYLSRLFNGGIDLKVEHLVRMINALGLQPSEFFRMAYPDTAVQPSRAAAALRGLLPDASAPLPSAPMFPAPPVTLTAEEVERKIETTVRKLFSEFARGAG
jgi:transcriptional regulator with XRE-family HTH domain